MTIIDNKILRHGWQKAVARRMGVHCNTIYNILQQGETHPKYAKMMLIAKNL
ncbi:MAG: helix-turn-helix domain-containing protein [Prevotellaceae bacterium]|jgi:transposase|nr:helix-turn-helix domain-containing protein [Prevotellaceae bacterium]